MRRLTVPFHVTVANYEYLVYWRFYQDGNIECEVRATGIMVTTPFPRAPHPNGTLVDERTYAPFHQHFLVARLDLDVDGSDNTVYMSESYAEPIGAGQPVRTVGWCSATSAAHRERGQAGHQLRHPAGVEGGQHQRRQRAGHPPAYKLVPGGAIPSMFDPASRYFQRATRDRAHAVGDPEPSRRTWPAGEFVNQSVKDTGLAEWTKADGASRTPTSCSGTCSVSTTSPDPRTGR